MFKVGQRVKLKPEHAYSGPPPHDPDVIFSIEYLDDSYASLSGQGYTDWVVPLGHIRPLMRKKPPTKPGVFKSAPQSPPVTLKAEIDWMKRVQKNFKGDGAYIPSELEAPVRAMREYFVNEPVVVVPTGIGLTAQPFDTGMDVAIEREREMMRQHMIEQQEETLRREEERQAEFGSSRINPFVESNEDDEGGRW